MTESIAIVGLAGRFPGAADVEEFWQLLMDGGDAVGPVPVTRWDTSGPLDPQVRVPDQGGFLTDIDLFDPTFFEISPREAADMDPQQRLMLEVAWQALEDAGQPAAALRESRTGVYVGASWHDYEILRKERGAPTTQHSLVGNVLDAIAARVSYALKLCGPSLAVETGCSSSLVALHLASQALRLGEIDAAVVGGVNLMVAPDVSVGLTHFGGLSPTGRCRVFSAEADGFVRGEGVVALLVKRLEDAIAHGDRIHAVVVRTAVNNDGGGESLVTPNPHAQEALLRSAYAGAGIPVDRVAYVEAHGTGTRRGDPIEAKAIGRVLGAGRTTGPLPIGSVKSNIGHLEPVAGLAGLVKVTLALRHRTVPASLHCCELNPDIDFEQLNLHVVREPLALPAAGPLYAGVSSFGWGGTNAHTILASAPALRPAGSAGPAGPVLVPLSAHQSGALRERSGQLARTASTMDTTLAALAGALAWRRDHFDVRAGVVADDPGDLADVLARYAADPDTELPEVVTGRARAHGRTAFVFPGQGSQWPGMGKELYAREPEFTATIDRCAAALRPHVDWDLVGVVSGRAGDGWLDRVDMVQPVLWAVCVGLAELWRAAGVEPDVVVGHSQGEVAAATVAGILSIEDAARVVARRSALVVRTTGRGGMLAVELSPERVAGLLVGAGDAVSLAAHNGSSSCVLSGDAEALASLRKTLDADGVYCRPVNVDYASHSSHMDELTEDLLAALEPIAPAAGTVPLVSTVLARIVDGEELDARYWMRNLRSQVRFAETMDSLLATGVTHVVEVSPHPILFAAIEELAAAHEDPPRVLASLRREAGSPRDFALGLAAAYAAGLSPFRQLPDGCGPALPSYPWQRSRFWPPEGRRRSARAGLRIDLTPAPAQRGAWTGTVELGTNEHPWLADHRVHDAAVLPGVAMLALALAAARSRLGAPPAALDSVTFHAGLTVGAQPVLVGADWRDDAAESGAFTLRSLADGATSWTTHATARVLTRPVDEAPPPFPDDLTTAPGRDTAAFYAACAARGLDYGPAFRTLTTLHVSTSDGQALGELRLGERPATIALGGAPHPALWDGALQLVLALADPALAPGRAVVPTGVRRVVLHSLPAEPIQAAWSHAIRRDDSTFDVFLYNARRAPLLTMTGVTIQALEPADPAPLDSERLHRMEFRPAPAAPAAPVRGPWSIAGGGPAGLAEAFRDAGVELGAGVAGAGIIYVAPGGGLATQKAGLATQKAGLLELTELVRAATGSGTAPRLVVVTRDAHAVAPGDRVDAGAALFWGFARVLRREHPELDTTVVDIGSTEPPWPAVVAEALAGDGEDQVVLRDGQRYVGRLTRGRQAPEPTVGSAPAWRTPPQPFRLATDRPGVFDGLCFRPKARLAPEPGEVEIQVTAAGLNFIDVVKALGTYPDPADGAVFGNECAGRVLAVGEGVTGFARGDRVVAAVAGALSSHVTVRADHARAIPATMDDADAAGVPVVQLTAWYALNDLARLEQGETVLIHSATGGLGLAAIGVARALGARIIATAGTQQKRDYLQAMGIEHVFDSRDLSWATGVQEVTGGRGVEVVLNSLTGSAIEHGLTALAEDGRFIEVGKTDIYHNQPLPLGAFRKRITFAAVDLGGMARTRPQRLARLLAEVWGLVTAGRLSLVPTTRVPFARAAEALRAMSTGTHIGKFVLVDPESVTDVRPQPFPLRADGTYLVTGGLGALGLSLAEYLADGGAGHLALLGRSAPDRAARGRIAGLRERGVPVQVVTADVADPDSLAAALAVVRRDCAQLRGVVHAAGVLDDATIGTLSPESLDRVLRPKVDGAVNLVDAVRDDPLDFFVLFSSMAALLGNPGQAAYAAGNAFLDALAVARRRDGRPALSVQWGPFAGVGLAAADELRGARLAKRGTPSFPVEEAWPALRRLLERGEQVVGYGPIQLSRWFEANPETASQLSWHDLRGTGPAAGAGEFVTWLRSLPPPQRPDAACAKVRELAGRVLGLDPAAVEPGVSFRSLGLDSLLSIELRNRLEAAFGLKLAPTILWTHRTAQTLAVELCRRLT